jgi:predicted alpha/beta superfamily hydrolase
MRHFKISLLFFLFALSLKAQVLFSLQSLPSKYTPELDTLFLAGNFNNWNPRDTTFRFRKNPGGQWQVRIQSSLNEFQYKITRGNWATVEVSATGLDISNRTSPNIPDSEVPIQVANWADTKGTHTGTAGVQILSSQVWLTALKRYRRIWVCLPSQYDPNGTERYPVLYMHDGQNVFDAATSFAGEWKVDEALLQLEQQAGWQPIIAVGIDNGGGDRLTELTPFRHPTYGGGNGENYARAVVETVKPLIDSHFRTLSDMANTGIGGSSLGGFESLFMAYAYPNVFSKALIFSPSLWFSDSLRQFCLAQPQPVNTRLYWVCGTNEGDADMIPDMNACYLDLLNAGMPSSRMSKKIITGGTHSEGFWSAQVKDGIQWLFGSSTAIKKKSAQNPPFRFERSGQGLWLEKITQSQNPLHIRVIDLAGKELIPSFAMQPEEILLPVSSGIPCLVVCAWENGQAVFLSLGE